MTGDKENPLFQGESIEVLPLRDGLVELRFDRRDAAINKLDARTMDEFGQATQRIAGSPDVRGVLVTSAKDVFIVGADITEFGAKFRQSADEIAKDTRESNELVNAFEDLTIPSVVAINGLALGGGLEIALLASMRVMSASALVGVPEVKLGLIPGLGGTVRLSRLAGLATAMEWVASGKSADAPTALANGVIDEIASPESLRECALVLLQRAIRGDVDWRAAQRRKLEPLPVSAEDAADTAEAARAKSISFGGKHQPAALMGIEMMAAAAAHDRAGAIDLESAEFGRVARTQAAGALVQAFLNQQALKKTFKHRATGGRPIRQAAVLGAGVMGGGIAFTSALHGTQVRLKDIAQPSLDLGMAEADKQLAKLVKHGRLDQSKANAVRAAIVPQLDDSGFGEVDCVIEAVVESLDVKRKVLAELEGVIGHDTVIASNTSSLRIGDIALSLSRPENFVGMHFFNPVPVMQLVEVIRGTRTSEGAVSTVVSYALAMGKTPVVVKDCPGFLVNRILTPYINAFLQLVADGADFEEIDHVMEAFGWPMGPAYLQDVVGMDVGSHVADVIGNGYPERMRPAEPNAIHLMVANGRYGQKSGAGFYRYEKDSDGRLRKLTSPEAHDLVATVQSQGRRMFPDGEILERMMVAMIVEAAHALEDGVVATPAELDTALLLGVGFPAYAGGALKYADWLGLDHVVALCEKYADLGPGYMATPRMRAMAAAGDCYYPA
ncbi:fatty acid oxidation complex subunit alpha FadB [Burkholderia pseudomallei]|nr:fatty acid oxidation complex subunit alpha FadB [Burkholderia pseudomallei]